jgi:IS5 family transposase
MIECTRLREARFGWRRKVGKGKARKPRKFGCNVSITTTNKRCKGGQFVIHAKALHGNPYDGHTLRQVIDETEALTGREIERVHADCASADGSAVKGYRGHDAPKPRRVFLFGQKRGVHGQIKKERGRRFIIEAVIGHMEADGHLDRDFLKGRDGDHANTVFTAVGYNIRLILNWLRLLLRRILDVLIGVFQPSPFRNPAC